MHCKHYVERCLTMGTIILIYQNLNTEKQCEKVWTVHNCNHLTDTIRMSAIKPWLASPTVPILWLYRTSKGGYIPPNLGFVCKRAQRYARTSPYFWPQPTYLLVYLSSIKCSCGRQTAS